MKTYTVGDLKTHFSEVPDMVQEGEEVYVTYGKKKEIVAQIVSPKNRRKKKRKLGLLKSKASFKIHDDWKMTDEEFLNS